MTLYTLNINSMRFEVKRDDGGTGWMYVITRDRVEQRVTREVFLTVIKMAEIAFRLGDAD